MDLVKQLSKIAKQKSNITPAQLAINWVRQQSGRNGNPVIIPIPGTKSVERVKENSTIIDLTENELEEIDSILKSFQVSGTRYGGHLLEHLEG